LSPRPTNSGISPGLMSPVSLRVRFLDWAPNLCALIIFACLGSFASSIFAETSSAPTFSVTNYHIVGDLPLPPETVSVLLSGHTGTNIALAEIVKAASDLQREYNNRGYPVPTLAIAQERITNGVVTINVFRGGLPQILVSGRRYST